jgi:cystathionine beta-synthase
MNNQPFPDYPSPIDLIGNTPLVKLDKICPNPNVTLLAKLEFYNPTFSIKDRMVSYILKQAKQKGLINATTTIVEASSGNTASAIAMMAAIDQRPAIITMPDSTSKEKIQLAKLYGAKVVLCPSQAPHTSPDHYTNKASDIAQSIPNSFMPDQYNNHDNIKAHYLSTAKEIMNQTHGHIDHVVGCASTGGTMSGIGQFIKEHSPNTTITIADSKASVFTQHLNQQAINTADTGSTIIEGAGKSYIPGCLKIDYIDEIITISDTEALSTLTCIARTEGLCIGLSASLALSAALTIIQQQAFDTPTTIVTILADSGLKYLSKLPTNIEKY